MSAPQLQNASQVFRKPAAPSPTRREEPPRREPHSDTYAVGVFRPAPQASEAPEAISDLPAGFWIRATARLLDGFLLTAVEIPVTFVGLMFWGIGPLAEAIGFVTGLNVVFGAFYFVFCHGQWGQTIGKMVFKIKVVTVEGLPLSMKTSVIRYVCEALSALTLGIGYLMAGVRSDKRGLHDLVGKTRVVRL